MSSSRRHLSSSFSSHLQHRLAGLWAKSVARPCLRVSEIHDSSHSLSVDFQRFGGVPSRPPRGGFAEPRSISPAWSRTSRKYDSAAGRSFSAVAGAGPVLSPSPGDVDVSCSPEKGSITVSPFHAPTSAYIHIPFCRRRCFYCDFTIVAVGERTDQTIRDHQDLIMAKYVDLVCKEIACTARKRRNTDGPPLETVFFGGGTPSLLPVSLFARIINELKVHFQIAENAEIAMEMDPGTFDREKLEAFLDCGISRVSLGVQSFQDDLLKACGRAHGLLEVYDAMEAIDSTGLQNWSLDLIASLPNQTMENWEHSLQQTISAGPAHVSVYDLQIEEGTLFHRWYKAGENPLPSDDKSAEFYRRASLRLQEAGFEHYEVSNYAKPGFQCRHNLVYWRNHPYFAFGLGSTSYVDGRRVSRPKKMREYTEYVDSLASSDDRSSLQDYPVNSVEDQILDTIMLSLRLARGLNLQDFEAAFGSSVTSAVCCRLVEYISMGLVEALDSDRKAIPVDEFIKVYSEAPRERGEAYIVETLSSSTINSSPLKRADTHEVGPVYVRLTDPEGFLVSNEVISSIFSALPSGGI